MNDKKKNEIKEKTHIKGLKKASLSSTYQIEPSNPYSELKTLFDPPTELTLNCFQESGRSFVEDRRWVGKRASEIVEKKFQGYNNVTNEELSLSFKQAWDERIAFCKAAEALPKNADGERTPETDKIK
ncbi:MAG: hypothetical protein ACFFB5_12730 [Promethearchaeota archaeon]